MSKSKKKSSNRSPRKAKAASRSPQRVENDSSCRPDFSTTEAVTKSHHEAMRRLAATIAAQIQTKEHMEKLSRLCADAGASTVTAMVMLGMLAAVGLLYVTKDRTDLHATYAGH